ncbi:LAGLIDADG family homing endonuclease [Persephonella sp.]
MQRIVIKRDGSEEKFQMKKLINAIFALLEGMDIPDDYEIVFKVAKELDLKIPERVTTQELDTLVLKAIEQLIPKHYIYDTLAAKQLLKLINREIDKRFSSFKEAVEFGVKEGLYKEDLLQFDIEKLENAIDYSRDALLDYFGMTTLRDRYFTRDRDGNIIEKPQWFFMRVAMGIGNNEEEVIKVYNKISKLEYLHSTPTLYNSGTATHQYSSCFPAGTPVLTRDGIKNIEEISVGDVVLTANGNYRVVSGLYRRKYARDLYKIKVWGLWGSTETVKATDDHKFLILQKEDIECSRKFVKVCPPYQNTEKCYPVEREYTSTCTMIEENLIENLQWVEAKDLKAGDFIVIPYPKEIYNKEELCLLDYLNNPYLVEKEGYIHKLNHDRQKRSGKYNNQINKIKSRVKLDYDFMRFLGYYLAEGYVNEAEKKLSLVFTFGRNDRKFINDVVNLSKNLFGIIPSVKENKDNSVRITINSTYVAQFIKNLVGTGFNKKFIPSEIMLASPEAQKGLIVGLFRGDATAVSDGYRLTISNKNLAYQVFHILLRIGSLPRISRAFKNHLATEEPYSVHISVNDSEKLIRLIDKDLHKITARPDKKKINSYRFRYNDYVFYKIEKIEKEYFEGTVYDFEVKGDHSFSANLIAAHNCYVNVIDDSLESIMDKAKETAFLAKYAGGVGTDVTRIRATGSKIHSLNAKSSGVIPFIKIFDTIVNAIQQGGRRRSSQVMYLQPWHLDIDAFLDLRETTGNPYFRTPSLNTAVWMPDEIMRRIKEGEPLYLFDPAECPELVTAWGEEFTKKYFECIEKAETGQLKLWKKIDSREWFNRYLFKLAKTGHPWLTFKDRHNEHNPCPEYGVINSSNLCVTGDTRLATQWGLVTAKELYKKGEPIIATYDKRTDGSWKDYGVSTAQCLKMFKTKENADVYEVVTKEGYRIKATDWHEFYRAVPEKMEKGKYPKDYRIEKVKLSQLKAGDKLLIQSGEGQFGTEGYYELGLLTGFIAGDGTFANRNGYNTVYVDLYNEDISLSEIVLNAIEKVIDTDYISTNNRQYTNGMPKVVNHTENSKKVRFSNIRLAKVLERYGFTKENKLSVPEFVFKGSRETVVGYLQGLFTADATVNVIKNEGIPTFSIQLASKERKLLEDVQILLSNFGIKCSISKLREYEKGHFSYTTKNGETRFYDAKPLYRLLINGNNAVRFVEEIGFLGVKQEKALKILEERERLGYPKQSRKNEHFFTTIKEIRYVGKEDVYDTTQLYNHSLIFNGIVTGNCTEISIPNSPESTAVCTLASVNLAKHINEEKTNIDWDKLRDTIETMVLALDNILDKNFYPSEESRKNTMDLRPLGIGLMGFAETLVELGIPYDSDEAVEFAEKVAKFMRETAYRKSEELAKERGAFPHYEEMKEKGKPYPYPPRRNAVLLAVAPTASISIIAGTTSSIDSYFSNVYSRDTLSGKFIVVNKQLMKKLEELDLWNEEMAEKIKAQGGSIQYIEELEGKIDKRLFKGAYEIHPHRQIDIAAAFQKYVDQAVSKSIYIEEDLRGDMFDIYMYAWEKGLKSTYYCFIDKTVKGEKYTQKVNKRGTRRGFGLRKSSPAENTETAKTSVEEDLEQIERMAREKYGDEVVDKVKSGDVDACPTDPLLSKICPSCE